MAGYLLDLIPQETNLLDVGSGIGHLAGELRLKRGVRCFCLDFKRLCFHPVPSCPFLLCDAHELAFREETFDTVLLITVLHHCRRPRDVLLEAKRVAKGKILLIEDVYSSRGGRLWTMMKDLILNVELFGHPRRFHTIQEWEEAFSELGLSVEIKREFSLRLLWVFRARHVMYLLRKENGAGPVRN